MVQKQKKNKKEEQTQLVFTSGFWVSRKIITVYEIFIMQEQEAEWNLMNRLNEENRPHKQGIH